MNLTGITGSLLLLAFPEAIRAAETGGTTNAPTVSTTDAEAARWSFSASAYTYVVQNGSDYVQPTFTADHGALHLEARYNYEDLDTASAWVGYNLSGGEALNWEVTPMLGGVFGETYGIAPGYKGSLGWRGLELYSEGEYVIDTERTADSFFYNWSELTFSPTDWLRFGFVTQRTRAYSSAREIQRGLLLGFTYRSVAVNTYWFNPEDGDSTVVLGLSYNF